ncbi:MAG TPA: glycoside hydrolase family 95 protein [Robiginitalea sp.]|nr:glycoside hydrolase family 95 protein [Robiginitalea sp.]
MRINTIPTCLLCCLLLAFAVASGQDSDPSIIWYNNPAPDWDHALPVGNGRLGAMVFGHPTHERLQLNEDSLWPGGPEWGDSKGTPADLEEIRRLILAGQVHLADSLIVERFSYKDIKRSHQTLGDLYLDFDSLPVTDYRRSLNLDRALAETRFRAGGHWVTQTVFASHPDQVLVVHLTTQNPEGLNVRIRLTRPDDRGRPTVTVRAAGGRLSMQGEVTQYGGAKFSKPFPLDHGVRFDAVLLPRIRGGQVRTLPEALELQNVQEATLLLVAATSFYHTDPQQANQESLRALQDRSYPELLEAHLRDYQSLYRRVSLNLPGKAPENLSTAQRLERLKDGATDTHLEEELFNFGRYLLISSSRPGTNPANLQGLWNSHIQAPWNADYHLNINLQMNYWPAEVTGLPECHGPLFDFTDRLLERGKILARRQYGLPGAVIHHTTDLWAPAWMQADTPYWGSWIHGGGWLSRHYWEHFAFTQDTAFLKERAYPALSSLSEFYLGWLIEDPRGPGLISVPETSPENSYLTPDGHSVAVAAGAAMGYQIMTDVFGNTLQAAGILGVEGELHNRIRQALERMPKGLEQGPDGRLLEWDRAYEEPEKGHRHISHLYALYPGDAISASDAALFRAAAKTIQYRLDHGGAGPGWSRAWIINFYARLLEPEAAYEHVRIFLKQSIYENLLDVHPPFQIDGNFGYTAGVAEMLLQSHEGMLRLLPALPKAWAEGSVRGLRARGNLAVDLAWANGALDRLTLHSPVDKTVRVLGSDGVVELSIQKNTANTFDGNLQKIE